MKIAVIGADASGLCRRGAVPASAFFSPAEAAGREWDLLALTPHIECEALSQPLRARCLLLPGDSGAHARVTRAPQVIGYGFSPRDTLTLSSFTGTERLLCIQRSLLTLGGGLIEPQEIPLSPALSALSAEDALFLAGISLLLH